METPFDKAKADRWFGVEFNNASWDLIEASSRTAEENDRLIHLAHAAYLHWLAVGKPIHRQRGLCLLANAYLAVGSGEAAKKYASALKNTAISTAQRAPSFKAKKKFAMN